MARNRCRDPGGGLESGSNRGGTGSVFVVYPGGRDTPGKPLTVKIYGTQEINLVVKNQSKHVTKHLLLAVELLPDAPEDGTFRLDRNLRSGFRINALDYKELSSSESDTPVVTNTPS